MKNILLIDPTDSIQEVPTGGLIYKQASDFYTRV